MKKELPELLDYHASVGGLLELLDGIIRNIDKPSAWKNVDNWERWADNEVWSGEGVHRALQRIRALVAKEDLSMRQN
jgi:hypothetical protein